MMQLKRIRTVILPLLVLLGIGAALAIIYHRHRSQPASAALGMVRQTEMRIAPETTGRLGSLLVKPGERVRKGDVLAIVDNPELTAALSEARAAVASARAERDRIFAGVRAEEVAIAAEAVRTAEANLMLARARNARIVALSSKGHVSQQQHDESEASLAKALAEVDLKRAQHSEAVAGPVAEMKALAEARIALAEAALATREAELRKLRLTAPADGRVGIQVAELGEIMTPGRPIMIITSTPWLGFTLREDRLGELSVGARVAVATSDGRSIPVSITELRPLGEFATWRAARAIGDHDLNSFRIRAEATSDATLEIEPGMSVWLVRPQ